MTFRHWNLRIGKMSLLPDSHLVIGPSYILHKTLPTWGSDPMSAFCDGVTCYCFAQISLILEWRTRLTILILPQPYIAHMKESSSSTSLSVTVYPACLVSEVKHNGQVFAGGVSLALLSTCLEMHWLYHILYKCVGPAVKCNSQGWAWLPALRCSTTFFCCQILLLTLQQFGSPSWDIPWPRFSLSPIADSSWGPFSDISKTTETSCVETLNK